LSVEEVVGGNLGSHSSSSLQSVAGLVEQSSAIDHSSLANSTATLTTGTGVQLPRPLDVNISVPSTDTSWIVSDLLPWTNFSVRVSAVNSLGSSDPSTPAYFTTDEEGTYHRLPVS